MTLDDLPTPALVLDRGKLQRNARRLSERIPRGVRLRPHFKTAKSIEVARIASHGRPMAATVSTLKEAEHLHSHGVTDITYAVGVAPQKLPRAADLVRAGCDLKLIADDAEVAATISSTAASLGVAFGVYAEVDVDRHRAGVTPLCETLPRIAEALADRPGSRFMGVLTHAGESYGCTDEESLRAAAEEERAGAVAAAERLGKAGFTCPEVSVGSSPTALHAESFNGVTEVRAGVYLMWDLVQSNLGLCPLEDIAVSVLGTVIGQQRDRGWLILDAGGHALSKDRGTAAQAKDYLFGQVTSLSGEPIPGWLVSKANQEHGIVESFGATPIDFNRYPIGSRLRILPNHACATSACHDRYAVVDGDQQVLAKWPRINGW
ncbi:MAG: alanine racemase [Planctomycetota bacterium]